MLAKKGHEPFAGRGMAAGLLRSDVQIDPVVDGLKVDAEVRGGRIHRVGHPLRTGIDREVMLRQRDSHRLIVRHGTKGPL